MKRRNYNIIAPDVALAPDGKPMMVIGRQLWQILEDEGSDMRYYRLSRSAPLDRNSLFKKI
jgi:hypothetical protein